jgi:hypothetical protein
MTLSNEYYPVFEIHTLFEPGDHPETWEGLRYGVYSGHVCLASTPQGAGVLATYTRIHTHRKVRVSVWRGKAVD